jgi:GH24 family phage-related lysozyme (muramidase)
MPYDYEKVLTYPLLISNEENTYGAVTCREWRDDPLEEILDVIRELKGKEEKEMKEKKEEEVKMEKKVTPVNTFEIKNVLANEEKGAFTVVWADGTNTVVHLQKGDTWDNEKALAMCFTKKALGNKGNFNNKFNDALDTKLKVIKKKEKKAEKDDAIKSPVFNLGADTTSKLEEATKAACTSIKETIEALCGAPKKTYTAYLVHIYGDEKSVIKGAENVTMDAVKEALYKKQKEITHHNYYQRSWESNGGVYVDFGSHLYYFYIPNATISEFFCN